MPGPDYHGWTHGKIDPIPVPVAVVVHNTNGSAGTFTAGAWRDRTIDNVQYDAMGIIESLSGNVLTLIPGTYMCRIKCPANMVDGHTAELYDTVDASGLLEGTSEWAESSLEPAQTSSWIIGVFTVEEGHSLKIRHQCDTTRAGDGFGFNAGYTGLTSVIAEFWRLGD